MRTTSEPQRPALPESGSGEAANGYGGMAFADDLHIRDYLQILYRRRWIIVAMLVLGLLGGMLRNWRTAPLFAASATVQVWAEPNVLGIDRPLSAQGEWMKEFLPTQLGVLSSGEIARLAHEESDALGWRQEGSAQRRVRLPRDARWRSSKTLA